MQYHDLEYAVRVLAITTCVLIAVLALVVIWIFCHKRDEEKAKKARESVYVSKWEFESYKRKLLEVLGDDIKSKILLNKINSHDPFNDKTCLTNDEMRTLNKLLDKSK